MADFYALLKVTRIASKSDIKSAYRHLALKLHPDITGNNASLTEQFKKVTDAYEVLIDEDAREEYDRSLPDLRASSSANQTWQGSAGNTSDLRKQWTQTNNVDDYINRQKTVNYQRESANKRVDQSHEYNNMRNSQREYGKHAQYYAKVNKKEVDKMRAHLRTESQQRQDAIDSLNKRRQERRQAVKNNDVDNERQSGSGSICIVC